MKKKFILSTFAVIIGLALVSAQLQAIEYNYEPIPGKVYAVLTEEKLLNSNQVQRTYDVYDGNSGNFDYMGSLHYGLITKGFNTYIDLPQNFNSLAEAKFWLIKQQPNSLRLPTNTLVSEKVFNQWITESYRHNLEYEEESLANVVHPCFQPDYSVIPKPYKLEGLEDYRSNKDVQAFIDNSGIDFRLDKPYELNGCIMVPIREYSEKLGYQMEYLTGIDGKGILKLKKNGNNIELSVWHDYVIMNGDKVYFKNSPSLSINNRIMVPLDLIDLISKEN